MRGLAAAGLLAPVVLFCLSGAPPAMAYGIPCPDQTAAAGQAGVTSEAVGESWANTVQSIADSKDSISTEAPEVLPLWQTIMGQLGAIDVPVPGNNAPGGPVQHWINVDSVSDLTKLNAGLAGPDGTQRASVARLAALVTQAQSQAVAVGQANQQLTDAVTELAHCEISLAPTRLGR
ncbi:MAG: hypothetical protein JOZ81_01505 [Chloroflexi bacterium]|nr:hypothetical protein [Chloroflexota bacterium]